MNARILARRFNLTRNCTRLPRLLADVSRRPCDDGLNAMGCDRQVDISLGSAIGAGHTMRGRLAFGNPTAAVSPITWTLM